MIAIVRKNLPYVFPKHNSFVCKSSVSLSSAISPHYFSTCKEKHSVLCPRIHDLLLHKHQFSPQVASLVASDFGRRKSPEKVDSVLSFLKESGFSNNHLEKLLIHEPRVLSYSVEMVKFKIKVFQDLGLSPEDVAKLVSSNQVILRLSTKSKINPSLSLLKGMLGPDYDVGKLLMKSAWFLCSDLEKTLVPNVELLKSIGISMDRIRFLLFCNPRVLLIKPSILRSSVDKAKEMGFNVRSNMFLYGVRAIASMSKGRWEVKVQYFRDVGFSERDILNMCKKFPLLFSVSIEKMEKIKQLLLATGRFDISSIVSDPVTLGCSIETRIKPRLRILGILESKELIKEWPSLSVLSRYTDAKFFFKFVGPYADELGEGFISTLCQVQKERKL